MCAHANTLVGSDVAITYRTNQYTTNYPTQNTYTYLVAHCATDINSRRRNGYAYKRITNR